MSIYRRIFYSNKNLATPDEQGADFVELFFDLVFVFAITRVTYVTAHSSNAFQVLQSGLIFWLIWWGWTQFTWTLNAANTRLAQIRMTVLIATGLAFVMASSVAEAFDDGVFWFVVPYILIRVIGIGLVTRVTTNVNEDQKRIIAFTIPSIIGWILLLMGAFSNPEVRIWWWIAALIFDMVAGYFGGKADGWDVKANHFAERHGLIVIIALGESLIVAASAVTKHGLSQDMLLVGLLAVLVTCLLWWSYFSWINEYLEKHLSEKSGRKQATLARDAYSFTHFPLICGIIGIAVGFEKILAHPNYLLDNSVALALGTGYIFFVGFTALSVWLTSGLFLLPRVLLLILTTIGIILSINQPPFVALGIMAIGLTLLTLIEWKKCRHA